MLRIPSIYNLDVSGILTFNYFLVNKNRKVYKGGSKLKKAWKHWKATAILITCQM